MIRGRICYWHSSSSALGAILRATLHCGKRWPAVTLVVVRRSLRSQTEADGQTRSDEWRLMNFNNATGVRLECKADRAECPWSDLQRCAAWKQTESVPLCECVERMRRPRRPLTASRCMWRSCYSLGYWRGRCGFRVIDHLAAERAAAGLQTKSAFGSGQQVHLRVAQGKPWNGKASTHCHVKTFQFCAGRVP